MSEQRKDNWVLKLADLLVFEILEQMCGIRVTSSPQTQGAALSMDTVYGFVDGEYQMKLRFRAEPQMFGRLAGNMMGEPPEQTDIQDYAEEFFNILCGRFVSEIYATTHKEARFLPTRYGDPPAAWCEPWEHENTHTRCFISEDRELAEFSWSFFAPSKTV